MKLTTPFMHTLTAQVLRQQNDGNVTLSPSTVMLGTVLVTLAATKDSPTHKEACAVLKMDTDNEDEYLEECKKIREDLTKGGGQVKVSMATGMWCQNVKSSFTQLCLDKLEAQVRELAGYQAINGWVAENTKGMIKDVLTTDPDGPLVAVPVLAFEGPWTYMMEDDEETGDFFFSPTEKEMQCPMMHLATELQYTEINGVQIVELPYGKDQEFKAYVLLPPMLLNGTGVSSNVEAAIDLIADTANWHGLKNSLDRKSVNLGMPQFKVEENMSLNDTLCKLGMPTAFGQDSTFGRLSDNPDVYLKNMQHLVKIEVNTVGTKAAAAAPVVFATRGSGGGRRKVIDMDVNRPFVFMITRDDVILFASLVRKPEQ